MGIKDYIGFFVQRLPKEVNFLFVRIPREREFFDEY